MLHIRNMTQFVNNNVSPGDIVQANDHNTQGARVANVINGNIDNDNIKANAGIEGSKLADNSITTSKVVDHAITAQKVNFTTLYSETIVLPTTISPLTTTYQSIGSITVPALSEPIKVQLIAKSHINHNGTGGIADYQMEIHNGTTSLDETIVSAIGGSYLYNLTCIAKTTLNGGEVISVRIKRGTAGSGGAGGGRSKLSIFRIGS